MDAVLSRADLKVLPDSRSFLRTFLTVYITGLAIVLFDLADGVLFVGDSDDQMRELQIRYLMSPDGRWFDLTLPFISMPETYVSPWSRLIDLPYAAIATLLRPFMPIDQALSFAFRIWPPLMLALFCLPVASTVKRLMADQPTSRLSSLLMLMLMTILMAVAVFEFSPGRIDHHDGQLVAMMLMVSGLVRWDRFGGALVGGAAALSVVIGLECLPLVVVAYAGLVLCYIAGVRDARAMIIASGAGMSIVVVAASLAFIGPDGIVSTQCDAFSAPYLFLLIGMSATLSCVVWVVPDRSSIFAKTLWLGLPSAFVLGLAAWCFPRCLGGPYQMIDPVSRAFWFSRIWQENSFLYLYESAQYSTVALLALSTCGALLAAPYVAAEIRRQKFGVGVAFAVGLASLLLTFDVLRNIRFPIALIPPFLPAAIAYYLNARSPTRGVRVAVGFALASVLAPAVLCLVIRPPTHVFDAVDYMSASDCDGEDFGVLNSVAAGRIALPQGIALPVLFARPAGFSVGAVPFHRASPGMRRMFEAFTSSDAAVRRAALEPFDYVAVCRFPLAADLQQAPLYAALAAGKSWPGLERVPYAKPSDFQLFRIDHAKLW
ncbi:hypothetical protein [Rhizobium grahamii]|uniref:Transmembrane protein n=1 Tax=Rhizobium grahamii CCGE 502 TaxID=990285 RepID=S3HX67_9HYPH|nr:hypothetical protein [Rhizobium grahamii]EPE97721.1 hypothetical protein RGCCGE502_12619 [Rhizobium grahamii CCGE 502]